MAGQFDGKVALITGAGSGIGQAVALEFSKEGGIAIVADISVEGGEATVGMIKEAGGEAVFFRTDVTQPAEVESLVTDTVKTCGSLDFAFNNVGAPGETGATADCTLENWRRVMNLNIDSVFYCMKYEIRQILKQGVGSIVNTSSIMGVVEHGDVPAYVTSKHAVIGLTRSAALAYVKNGIRVNAICPGNTDTPIFDPAKANSPEAFAALLAGTPMGRLARPEEIAGVVLWLFSDGASYCTGHAMVVDGCYTVQ